MYEIRNITPKHIFSIKVSSSKTINLKLNDRVLLNKTEYTYAYQELATLVTQSLIIIIELKL